MPNACNTVCTRAAVEEARYVPFAWPGTSVSLCPWGGALAQERCGAWTICNVEAGHFTSTTTSATRGIVPLTSLYQQLHRKSRRSGTQILPSGFLVATVKVLTPALSRVAGCLLAAMSTTKGHYTNPTVDDDDLIDPDDADLNDFDDPLAPSSSRAPLTGNIGSSSRPLDENYLTARIPGEDRSASQNTIDETVWETLRRDLLAVWAKLREVLYPRYLLGGTMFDGEGGFRGAYSNIRGAGLSGTREELTGLASRVMDPEALLGSSLSPGLRDWDLWGPLIFCLLLSLLLSFSARAEQKDAVFSGVFAMIWLGEALVTLQIRLLGGSISFAQSVCIIGYTLFPLVIAALLSALHLHWIPRIPIFIVLILWSLAAGVSILGGSGVVQNRLAIALYPLFIFYVGLGALCFMS